NYSCDTPYLVSAGLIDDLPNHYGVLRVNVLDRLADIRDGTSNTFLLHEDAGRPQAWRVGRLVPNLRFARAGWANREAEYITHGFAANGIERGPCVMNCTNDNEDYSFHPGGVNVVFCDGSVHFLRQTISTRIWCRLVTKAGGETVSASDY